MEKTIPGEEKCFDNKSLGEESIVLSNAAAAPNRDKLGNRNDRPWRCKSERLAG